MGQPGELLTRLEPGSLFAGYRIEGMLDRGGMGVVYRATDEDLSRTVALKIIAPEHTQNPDAVRRFKSEARLAASLEHPNIVPIHRGGEYRGVLYLAMRFVPGTNLRQVIDRDRLSLDRVRRIVAAVASALEPRVAAKVLASMSAPRGAGPLSAREREVAHLAAGGLTSKEIADRLHLSPLTVKTHVSRVLSKLGARDRVQLVVSAYESGLVLPGQ
jgi:DNA-binding CsgD family transcriptional regulator